MAVRGISRLRGRQPDQWQWLLRLVLAELLPGRRLLLKSCSYGEWKSLSKIAELPASQFGSRRMIGPLRRAASWGRKNVLSIYRTEAKEGWPRLRTALRALVPIALLVDAVLVIWTLVLMAAELWYSPHGNGGDSFAGLRNLTFLLAAAVGAPFVVWRSVVAQRQADAARRQTEVAESANITSRITQAVAQLGAEKTVKRPVFDPGTGALLTDARGLPIIEEITVPNLEVRLGGIYALERIAQDSERDHIPIMETLCAYVRQNAPAPNQQPNPEANLNADGNTTEPDTGSGGEVDEASHNQVIGSLRVDIQTVLTVLGRRSADRIEYEKTREPRYRLDLRRSNLRNSDLTNANFASAIFEYADISNSILEKTNLREANLNNARLVESKSLGANFEFASMQYCCLHKAELIASNLFCAFLIKANLRGASLISSSLIHARLLHTDLRNAYLYGARLEGAVLDFSQADDANFGESILTSASCLKATITQAQFDSAFGDGGTRLPDCINRPEHWPGKTLDAEDALNQWRAWRWPSGNNPE